MILKPRLQDVKIIGFYLGQVILGLALCLLIPIGVGLAVGEINPILDFVISAQVAFLAGLVLTRLCKVRADLNWMHGMMVVSLSWLAAMAIGALPLFLSGHWGSYLNACFDSMSGFATTGLTLVERLDHLSLTHNFWRHLTMFIGGQGIVIIALSLFVKGVSGAFKMYASEAREERILPNVIQTSRFIWLVSLFYLVVGTGALGAIGIMGGLPWGRALFHGTCIFMAAFDTGGFTPQSQSVLYYHSLPFEAVTMVLMILGALNFNVHYHVLTRDRREIWRNIETVTFIISLMLMFLLVDAGFKKWDVYPQTLMLFRKGFYQLISAHTGTGYQTLYAGQFLAEWPQLSLFVLILAMMIGGAVCSTTGAIKLLRVGIICKAFLTDIRRMILPERAVIAEKFHHIKDRFLEDKQVRSAVLITIAYLVLYLAGTVAGMLCGYPMLDSLFESTSAAANVGLSCGITTPAMPEALKVVYILQMWAGRLEFMAIFTLIGFFVALAKGRG